VPEPFKNRFSVALVEQMAKAFKCSYAAFDQQEFVETACHPLPALELKQRSQHIVATMHQFLPSDFNQTATILQASLTPMATPNCVSEAPEHAGLLQGWAIMPMADFVGIHGQAHFDLSMTLLYEMTQRFTAEFAIRYFLVAKPEQTLAVLSSWLPDSSEHVRRLISEGTRPRLPWGMQLKDFVKNPAPILPLLEALKDDDSEYVRRSVANNLNDIAKDHPQVVIKIAKSWLHNASKNRVRLVKHACRTLFKQGVPEALALFEFLPPKAKHIRLVLSHNELRFGESLSMSLSLSSDAPISQQIMLDYVVYHQKANGKLLPKVFKWKVITLSPYQSVELQKNHSFRTVTTRQYYQGEHRIAVLINGKEFARQNFHLTDFNSFD
jgi:3-methyladenine DNA glycosylase AlkC